MWLFPVPPRRAPSKAHFCTDAVFVTRNVLERPCPELDASCMADIEGSRGCREHAVLLPRHLRPDIRGRAVVMAEPL